MEIRAAGETAMSRDLTPPVPPLAASLHDPFLRSRCSSCFLPVPASLPPSAGGQGAEVPAPPCCLDGGALRYCSSECRDADLDAHAASGECQLLRLLQHHHPRLSAWQRDDTTDLRAALRLMHAFEKMGFTLPPGDGSRRIGGLLAGDRGQLEEGCELSERVKEGGMLMYRSRSLLREEASGGETVKDGCDGGGEAEEAVLWAVLTNAVEVQVDKWGALGIAVYGPQFSWFNHSCAPNACYRFELLGSELFRSDELGFLIHPTGTGRPDDDMMATWVLDERKLSQGLCRYGPRIVVRSIRPIRQGEEVCITYVDLLKPKSLRHSDLWSKYRFICHCKRCSAYPEMYLDHVLSDSAFSLDTVNLDSAYRQQMDDETEEAADILDGALMEYLSIGATEACCSYVENMLSKGFREQPAELSQTRFKLQPLHHISLKAYIALASVYRTRACDLEASMYVRYGVPEALDMRRSAAAYSLLLAGATNHLFLSEPSLIAATSLFWINAGESFLVLVRSLINRSEIKWVNLSEHNIIFHNIQGIKTCGDGSSLSYYEFKVTSSRFIRCVSRISASVWQFVVSGTECLADVKNPTDFSWLERKNIFLQTLMKENVASGACHSGNEESKCIGCKCEAEMHDEEDNRNLYRLAIHCLVYGGYLATICYGYKSYWIDHIRMLLCGEAWR